jgi:hypothetical protein
LDNFSIDNGIQSVPEPAMTGVLAALFAGLVAAFRKSSKVWALIPGRRS